MTFLAIRAEFWPAQIIQIRLRAEALFNRRPHDDDLESAERIRASIIPFEMYGYGFKLVLCEDVWTLEVASFPPHAEPGKRVRKARRLREQRERKERSEAAAKKAPGKERGEEPRSEKPRSEKRRSEKRRGEEPKGERPIDEKPRDEKPRDEKPRGEKPRGEKPKGEKKAAAERAISTAMNAISLFLSNLYNISHVAYAELKQLRLKAALFLEDMELAITASPRQEMLRWLLPSLEDCRAANIAAWALHPLPHGFQRERRLFFPDFMPIWIDTIGPIETIFVRGGKSIFGELFLEGEWVS